MRLKATKFEYLRPVAILGELSCPGLMQYSAPVIFVTGMNRILTSVVPIAVLHFQLLSHKFHMQIE